MHMTVLCKGIETSKKTILKINYRIKKNNNIIIKTGYFFIETKLKNREIE